MENFIENSIYFVVLLSGFYIYHKFMLWAESKGWIYYKKKSSVTMSSAFQELNSFLNPACRHVIEYQVEQKYSKKNKSKFGKNIEN